MWKKIQSDKEIPFQFRIFKSGIPDSVPPLYSILEMAMQNWEDGFPWKAVLPI